MSWLRLEAAYFQNPNVMRAGWDGAIVFLAAMTMMKLHGMRDGRIPKDDFTPEMVRRHLGVPKSRHSDKRHRDAVSACVRSGLLGEDETAYSVRSWRKFQPDPTAAARQAKSRAAKDVTVSHGDIRESRQRTDVRTYGRGEDPPLPPKGGTKSQATKPKKRKFRPRDRDRFATVLEFVIAIPLNEREQRTARDHRVALQGGALTDEAIVNLLATTYKRVTRRKLAKWKATG